MVSIKVGFLISYDYEFVKISLPRVYNHVSEIYFAVDIEGKTWSGQDFDINHEFWIWINEFDTQRKITIYRDKFYIPGLSSIECDTRERNMLSKRMGHCDWYIQIDSDEYFVDFGAFVKKLKDFKPLGPTTVACRVATLFKQVNTGYLVVGDSIERLNFATNNPIYDIARINNSGNAYTYWDDLVIHQSWARITEEINLKLRNWGHKDDFNVDSFFNLWVAIDEHNYYALKGFHPLDEATWPKLEFISGDIDQLLASQELYLLFNQKPSLSKRKSLLSRLWKEIKLGSDSHWL